MKDQKDPCLRQASLENLTPLAEFIETFYNGDQEYMRKQLIEIMYMLHYIDPQSFDQTQVQEKSFLLYRLAECLGDEKSSDPLRTRT